MFEVVRGWRHSDCLSPVEETGKMWQGYIKEYSVEWSIENDD